jgi:hypothetical protein
MDGNDTPSLDQRRQELERAVTRCIGEGRLASALSREELAQLEGLERALAVRNAMLLGDIVRCHRHPTLDGSFLVYHLIGWLSDNNDGRCRLGVQRIAQIVARDERSVRRMIERLEADGLIGVDRPAGLPHSYWPLVPIPLARLRAPALWFVDALSEKPGLRGRPKKGGHWCPPLSEKTPDSGAQGLGKNPGHGDSENPGHLWTQ